MAKQIVDYEKFNNFITESNTRLDVIKTRLQDIEKEYNKINELWTGKNANAFIEAKDALFGNGMVEAVKSDIENIDAFLKECLLEVQTADKNASAMIEGESNE